MVRALSGVGVHMNLAELRILDLVAYHWILHGSDGGWRGGVFVRKGRARESA
jgi:hypothetical protein